MPSDEIISIWKEITLDPFRDDEDLTQEDLAYSAFKNYIFDELVKSVGSYDFYSNFLVFYDDILKNFDEKEIIGLAIQCFDKFIKNYNLQTDLEIVDYEMAINVLKAIYYFESKDGFLKEFVFPIWNKLDESIWKYIVTLELEKSDYLKISKLFIDLIDNISNIIIRVILRSTSVNNIIFVVLEKFRQNVNYLNFLTTVEARGLHPL